ncbi:MAG: hypothetical protein QXI33_03675 [Candidatus Pacearchaeota archaeon]
MNQTIKVAFIIEILGRPVDHLTKTLEALIDQLGKEKGVNITERIVHEPKVLENKKLYDKEIQKKLEKSKNIVVTNEIFTTFAEIEAEFESIESLLYIAFNYMPSHIEIISPETFIFKNSDISGLLTGIIMRLHKYDEIAKKLSVDKTILEEKINEMLKQVGKTKKPE